MCYKEEPSQALVTQDQAARHQYNVGQPIDASHPLQKGDFSFMNNQPKEHCCAS